MALDHSKLLFIFCKIHRYFLFLYYVIVYKPHIAVVRISNTQENKKPPLLKSYWIIRGFSIHHLESYVWRESEWIPVIKRFWRLLMDFYKRGCRIPVFPFYIHTIASSKLRQLIHQLFAQCSHINHSSKKNKKRYAL